jgi:predicted  nucleic acid-binding Zn-ribbon protein
MGRKDGTFIRRCHVCGQLTEHKEVIDRCTNCGKALAPFCYFDERKAATYAADLERPPPMEEELSSIVGISAYWPP